jgi:hypothetical protein
MIREKKAAHLLTNLVSALTHLNEDNFTHVWSVARAYVVCLMTGEMLLMRCVNAACVLLLFRVRCSLSRVSLTFVSCDDVAAPRILNFACAV